MVTDYDLDAFLIEGFEYRLNPGGYSIYPWVGRCGPAPHTLTLFKTKIADFPTLFKTFNPPKKLL